MKFTLRPPLAIATENRRKKCLTKLLQIAASPLSARPRVALILTDRNSRIIKIRQICRQSASLYYVGHQTSLKTEWFCANSGRWNLVTTQNNSSYCWPMKTIRTIFSTDFVNTESTVIINLIPNQRN